MNQKKNSTNHRKAIALTESYNFKVFYLSSIIASIPMVVLASMIPLTEWNKLFWAFEYANYFTVAIGIILLSPVTQAKRSLAKYIENKLFDYGKCFPTTEMLLLSDTTLSRPYKENIRKKAETLSSILLLDESTELSNPDEARRTLKDIMVYIRRYAEGIKFHHDANIAYGFVKNMAAGLIIVFPFTILAMILFYQQQQNEAGLYIVGAYAVFSLIYLLFSKQIIKERANNYAQRLFEDFMTKD